MAVVDDAVQLVAIERRRVERAVGAARPGRGANPDG
jgi:hypothetical protein